MSEFQHISKVIDEWADKFDNLRGESMKFFIVSSDRGWFVVKAKTERLAKTAGINEWGIGTIVYVRLATRDESRGMK
jgi:hypothetical protein